MPADDVALRISQLNVRLRNQHGGRPILDQVNLLVHRGETVALVGESGSGKSVTARSALGLFPPGAEVRGTVTVGDVEVVGASPQTIQHLRRTEASMIFQDPRSSVNPVNKIKKFLTEGLIASGTKPHDALEQGRGLLESVGIRDVARVLDSYPHQLSGGMLQRIIISAALAANPQLLLADEPTTALDVTTQAEVVSLLDQRRAASGSAMLFVTHNLDLAAAIASRIYVMYAGRIVEHGDVEQIFGDPAHPYTKALFSATPSLHLEKVISAIPGKSPSLAEAVHGCAFASRCALATDECRAAFPELREVRGRQVACIHVGSSET